MAILQFYVATATSIDPATIKRLVLAKHKQSWVVLSSNSAPHVGHGALNKAQEDASKSA
jgi:hypothetical protein